MKKLRMATPGPTQVPQEILIAGAREVIHHRSTLMEEMMAYINAELPHVFGTTNDVYIMASSGTGAMEAAVANCFRPGDKVVVVNNGYFGERFEQISTLYGLEVIPVKSDWGTSVRVEDIQQAYEMNPDIRGVLVVYSETSTGARNDVERIGRLFQNTDVLVIVDAISGLIAHELKMDAWGLDVVLAASHKGFMMPPGLAFATVSSKAWSVIEDITPRTFYFSFKRFRQFFPLAPSSPAVSLLMSLKTSLDLLRAEGLAACTARHEKIARGTRAALQALGLPLFVTEPHMNSNTVSVALMPSGINASELLKNLQNDFGLTVTGGQGQYKGRMIRIGHIGAVDEMDLFGIFGAIEIQLSKLGHRFDTGISLQTLIKSFQKEYE